MSDLPAGRELDALVAEKVMGWEVFDLGYYGTEDETERMRELDDWLTRNGVESVGRYYIHEAEDICRAADRWSPSTDISAAWEVHEAMCKRVFSVRRRYFDAMQEVVTAKVVGGGGDRIAWPDVLCFLTPDAITLAALKAVWVSDG